MEPETDPQAATAALEPRISTPAKSSMCDALERARPGDSPARVIAEARVAGALFGSEAGTFGRFRVLERLGSGAMGVVYAAYDPELDRGVALKLLRTPMEDRPGVLAEAKALARLSHPNVVPIYDVGIEQEHVYMVMELVRGSTLRRWVEGREWQSITDAYRQAGEALAAAHAVGLVHRDFKPDNAIIGGDGRVRVVDFGLACEVMDPERSQARHTAAGTPGYIAPEHVAGAAATPAADQYSFAVALAEALQSRAESTRPLPRWLKAVIERGSASDPGERFASMRELTNALGRDSTRLRWQRLAAAAALLVGTAFLLGRATFAVHDQRCSDGEARLDAAWAPSTRSATLERIARLNGYGATVAPRIDAALRDHGSLWASSYRDACLARGRGDQSDALIDRRMACLERSRSALRSVADIAQGAASRTLPDVLSAVRALPDPKACDDLSGLLADIEPPPATLAPAVVRVRSQLDEARIQIAAGRLERADQVVTGAITEARALGYKPLLAEALLVAGRAKMGMSPRVHAAPLLAEAATLAFEAGADALGVEAWARRAWVEGVSGVGAASLAGFEVVEAIATRASATRFARALLYNNVGGVELALEHRTAARAAFERALGESRGVTGPGAIELVNVRRNLGLIADDSQVREKLLAEGEAELAKFLGEEHPETLEARSTRALMTVSLARAIDLLAPTCEAFELHPSITRRAVACWSKLAFLRREVGDVDGAIAALERADQIGAADRSNAPEVHPYLLLWNGDAAAAVDEFRRALTEREPAPNDAWWDRLQRAELELGLGRALRALRSLHKTRATLQSSVTALTAIAEEHSGPVAARILCRARAELAKTLAETGTREPELGKLARSASAFLREEGGPLDEIAELERLDPSK